MLQTIARGNLVGRCLNSLRRRSACYLHFSSRVQARDYTLPSDEGPSRKSLSDTQCLHVCIDAIHASLFALLTNSMHSGWQYHCLWQRKEGEWGPFFCLCSSCGYSCYSHHPPTDKLFLCTENANLNVRSSFAVLN